jgi:hypothetical protein
VNKGSLPLKRQEKKEIKLDWRAEARRHCEGIEIHGDKREKVARIPTEANFRPVFAGG